MKHYQIVNIQEILAERKGHAYRGEIAVFVSDNSGPIALGNGYPVYVHAFSYVLVLEGKADLSVDEQIFRLEEGTLCLFSPLHLTCFTWVSGDFKCVFLCLHKDFIDRMGAFNVKQRIAKGINMHRNPMVRLQKADAEILENCLMQIEEQIVRTQHLYHLALIQNALARFYLELDNILDRENGLQPSSVVLTGSRVRLQEFMTLLLHHYKHQHHVAFYADALHVTPQYLTLLVKRQTGKTVNAFINELIYSEARNLLSSAELTVQQISEQLQFADQASFSKFFKRHAGVSPQGFRQKALMLE